MKSREAEKFIKIQRHQSQQTATRSACQSAPAAGPFRSCTGHVTLACHIRSACCAPRHHPTLKRLPIRDPVFRVSAGSPPHRVPRRPAPPPRRSHCAPHAHAHATTPRAGSTHRALVARVAARDVTEVSTETRPGGRDLAEISPEISARSEGRGAHREWEGPSRVQ